MSVTLRALAFVVAVVLAGATVRAKDHEKFVDQNWSPRERIEFWFLSEGSQILPRSWFNALEAPDSSGALFKERLRGFGFIPWVPVAGNPDGLPIGFAIDRDNGQVRGHRKGREYVGLTCAACHTARIDHPSLGSRSPTIVEGGPALIDFHGFLDALVSALRMTLKEENAARFERFEARVAGSECGRSVKHLAEELRKETALLEDRLKEGPLPHPPGPGRVDALGLIGNHVVTYGLGDPGNGAALDAPVSYPFLWGTPQSDVVQWNGSAWNRRTVGDIEVGPLARNVGQALGSFADFEIDPPRGWKFWRAVRGYDSTVQTENLLRLERLVEKLRSPPWPADFPRIDSEKAARGAATYAAKCAACHEVISPDRQHLYYQAKVLPVGTDPEMADRFADRVAKTHALEGVRTLVVKGEPFGPLAPQIAIVFHTVAGVLLRNIGAVLTDEYLLDAQGVARLDAEGAEGAEGRDVQHRPAAYKARPLNGIWATAPYLHNGSVPTLWHLLKPAERPPTFCVGRRKFDAQDVGYYWQTEECPAGNLLDTSRPGNSNRGHEYGVDLTEPERRDLVEYMKGL